MVAMLRTRLTADVTAECAGVILITNSQEERRRGASVTTYDTFVKISWPGQVLVIDSDTFGASKGALLNAALPVAKSLAYEWLGVFDVDSVLDPAALAWVAGYSGHAGLLQQPSWYLDNVQHVAPALRPVAGMQTLWALGAEAWRIVAGSHRASTRGRCGYYRYPVAHGMFLSRDVLHIFRRFPERYEDLRLAIPLLLEAVGAEVIPYVDKCQFAMRVDIWLGQSRNWANGSWYLWYDLATKLYDVFARRPLAARWLSFQATLSNLAWASEGALLIVTATAAPVARTNAALALFAICCAAVLIVEGAYLPRSLRRSASLLRLSDTLPQLPTLWSVARPILTSIGPFIAAFDVLVRWGPNRRFGGAATEKSGSQNRDTHAA